jgi:hypothetical protein
MKLLGFGKKKDDRVEEFIIRKDLYKRREGDTERNTNGTEENEDIVDDNIGDKDQKNIDAIEENNSDYIDLEDLNLSEYEDIVSTIEANGWHTISDMAYPITNLDTKIVFQKTDSLEILCPSENIIAICGLNEGGVDMDSFYNGPNINQVPHFITLMCTVDDVPLSQTTLISILKYTKDGEIKTLYQEFYGDLSPVIDGKLKRKEDRYYFVETIILQGGEKLVFKIRTPGTIVSKIDLLMLSDVFGKDEE